MSLSKTDIWRFLLILAVICVPQVRADSSVSILDLKMSDADKRHLLARTGFGVAPADYLALDGFTRREGIEWVIASLQTNPSRPMPNWTTRPLPHYHSRGDLDSASKRTFDNARDEELASLRTWWVGEMLGGNSPATERLVLLWHDLVPSNYHAINRGSLAIADQNALFRRMHQGPWSDLLKALMRDTALLQYLDNDSNKRSSPNENLGRELLELFTLGEGNYDEGTVREAARALTGFSTHDISYPAFRLRTWQQDRDDKILFGRRGPHDADDLIDIILQQPEAARYLALRYWNTFVSDLAPPADALDTIAIPFRESGHDLGVLYREVLQSESFWAEEHRGMLIKSPVDLITGLARTLDYPKRNHERFASLQGALGLAFFDPPNVAGWDEGEAWISPARMLSRLDVAESIAEPTSSAVEIAGVDSMASESMSMDMADGSDMSSMQLRVASEDFQGPAEFMVSTIQDGSVTWQSDVVAVRGGHDTRMMGMIGARSDLPWQTVAMQLPSDVVSGADAVEVNFINDWADESGDRNLYVGSVSLGDHHLLASDGVQQSDCVPKQPGRAGDLYCGGTVVLEVPDEIDLENLPEARAAAVRLRSLNLNKNNGTVRANLMLEHVQLGSLSAELLQFRIVAKSKADPELRIDSFDCRGTCIDVWPECAWRDPHFPEVAATAISLVSNKRDLHSCLHTSFDPRTREWLSALADEVPFLLEQLTESRIAQRRPEAFAVLVSRVTALTDPNTEAQLVIDAGFAPKAAPLAMTEPVSVQVSDLDALVAALLPTGTDPVSLLWPGFDFPAELADATPAERLTKVLAHPAFQVR